MDATQDAQAQAVANLRLYLKNHLTIIPLINKIDNAKSNVRQMKKKSVNYDQNLLKHKYSKFPKIINNAAEGQL